MRGSQATVRVLDGIVVSVPERPPRPPRGPRERLVLACLALAGERGLSRDQLLEAAWNGSADASSKVRVQIGRLRSFLDECGLPDAIETTSLGYRLRSTVIVDVAQLEAAFAGARQATDPDEIVALLEPHLPVAADQILAGLEDVASVSIERSRLIRMIQESTRLLAGAYLDTEQPANALDVLQVARRNDPFDESIAVLACRASGELGQLGLALQIIHELHRELAQIGLSPGPAALEAERAALSLSNADRVESTPSGAPTGTFGRETAWALLSQAVEDSSRGAGSVITLEAEAGLGKTHLLQALAQATAGNSLRVMTAGAIEFEREHPFHILRDVIEIGAERSMMVDLDEWIDDALSAQDAGFDPQAPRYRVIRRLKRAIHDLGVPLLVTIDDAQWLDGASAAVTRSLARLAQRFPLALVVASRPGVDWRSVVGDAPHRSCSLQPLDQRDTLELVEAMLGVEAGPRLRDAVASLGGVPVLVVELVRSLELDGLLGRSNGVIELVGDVPPSTLESLVRRRLGALDLPERQLVDLCAVAGGSATLDMLSEMLERRHRDVEDSAARVAAAGLVRVDQAGRQPAARIAHDLLRQQIYESIAPETRAQLHRHVSRWLASQTASPLRVAAHTMLASPEVDDSDLPWIVRAASETAAVHPEASLTFIERALEATQSPDERQVLLRAKVDALVAFGDLPAATDLVSSLTEGDDVQARSLRFRLAGLLLSRARASEAHTVLDIVDEDNVATPQELSLRAICNYALFDQPGALDAASEALRRAAPDDVLSRSIAHGLVGRTRVMEHNYQDGLRSCLASAELADADSTGEAHLYIPWYFVGMTRLDVDDHHQVEDALERGRAVADRLYLSWTPPFYSTLEAALAVRVGDLDRAERAGREVLDMEEDVGFLLPSAWLRALLAIVALERGKEGAAARYLDVARTAQAAGSTQGAHIVVLADARLRRQRGDDDGAFEVLAEAWQFFDDFGLHACKPHLAAELTELAVERSPDVLGAVRRESLRLANSGQSAAFAALGAWVEAVSVGDSSAAMAAATDMQNAGRLLDAQRCRQVATRL